MGAIFETILRMSLTASAVILAVLLSRLALKKAPKKVSYLLWVIVLLRLLCPFGVTVELPFGVEVDTQLVETLSETPVTTRSERIQTPRTHEEAAAIVNAGTHPETTPNTPDESASQESNLRVTAPIAPRSLTRSWLDVLSYVWLAGVLAIAAYSVFSLLALKRRLRTAIPLGDNCYEAEIETPFVLGVLRPKIYLPANLSESERDYIVLHERLHIRNGDHIVKLLAFAALALHWFNPLVWLAFSLAGQDMEMRCDELVMARTGGSVRADYAQSLLNLSAGHRRFAATPLAFGEGTPKARIKNILKWKKPTVIAGVAAGIAVVLLIVLLSVQLEVKKQTRLDTLAGRCRVSECVYQNPAISMYYTPENSPHYMITEDGRVLQGGYGASAEDNGAWEREDVLYDEIGRLQSETRTKEEILAAFDKFSDWEEAQIAKARLSNVTDIWRASRDGQSLFLLQTKKDGLYLMACAESRQGALSATYLWKLEQSGDALPLVQFEQELREDADDGNLGVFAFYELENGVIVGTQSGSRLGFAIYEKRGSTYRMTAQADLGRGDLLRQTITQTAGLETSVTVALSSREDLAYVTARAGESYQEAYSSGCPAMAVFVWPEILPDGTEADVQFYNAADRRLDAQADELDGTQDEPEPILLTMEDVLAELPSIETAGEVWIDPYSLESNNSYFDVNGRNALTFSDMEAIYGEAVSTQWEKMVWNGYARIDTYPGGSQASAIGYDEDPQAESLYLLPKDGMEICGIPFGAPWQDVVARFCCETAEEIEGPVPGTRAILLYGTYRHLSAYGLISFDADGNLHFIEYGDEGFCVRFYLTDGVLSAVQYAREGSQFVPYVPEHAPQPLAYGMEDVLAALPQLYNDNAQWLEGTDGVALGGRYYDVNGKNEIVPADMEAIYGAPVDKELREMYPDEYDAVLTYPGGSQASGFCNRETGEVSFIGSLYLLPADGLRVCGFPFGVPWQDVVSKYFCESAEPFYEEMHAQQALLLYGTYVHMGTCGFIAFDESGMLNAIEYQTGGFLVRFCFTDGLLSAVAYRAEESLKLPY